MSFTLKYFELCYAPNDDMKEQDRKKQFFKHVFNDIEYQKYNHIMYAGDINKALNHNMETCSSTTLKQETTSRAEWK